MSIDRDIVSASNSGCFMSHHKKCIITALLLFTLSPSSRAFDERNEIYVPSFMRLSFVIDSMNNSVQGTIASQTDVDVQRGNGDQQMQLIQQMHRANCKLHFTFSPTSKARRQQTKQISVKCKGDEKTVSGYIVDSDGQTGFSKPVVGASAYAVFKEGFSLSLDYNE